MKTPQGEASATHDEITITLPTGKVFEVTVDLPTHQDQECNVILRQGRDGWVLVASRRSDRSYRVTVNATRRQGWIPGACNCKAGTFGRSCYHRRIAKRVMDTRHPMALERLGQLKEAFDLLEWDRRRVYQEVKAHMGLEKGDLYGAVLQLERRLPSLGIVREEGEL